LPDAVRAQFMVLRQRFVAGLPQRWQEIQGAADATALQAALHRLAGSAGSYGCEQLGECVRVTQSCAAGLDGLALAQALRQLQSEILRLQEPA
jgi:HPt (histidine-containing phosphotransfer) domain-containing protein